MKKTLITLGSALFVVIGAWAQNSFTVNGLNYLETGVGTGKVKITGYTIEPTGVFDIPETVSPSSGGSYTVTKIGDEVFSNCTNLTEVIFPSTITEIGEYAFYYSRDLTSITCYASTPPAMGENAFGTADKTIPVYVPANALSSYQSNADWSEFTRTTHITFISNNLEYKLLYTSPNQAEIIGYTTAPTGVLNIPATVSHKGKDYTIITIAEEVFSECSGLTELVFSESLRTIGAHAFHYCQDLTSITCYNTTPPNVGTSAFANTDETIPVYVPAEALSSYQSNAGWSVFTNLQAIAVNEFTVGGLTYEVTDQIAKTVEVINFTDELPSTVTIPPTVSYGGKNYTVTAIASDAFYQNQTITEITISEGITSIGDYTFNKCVALTTVNIPASLTQMGDFVFNKCTALTAINVASGNTAYCSENGVLFNKEKTTLLCYPAGKPETDYTIPSSVTVIGVNAFSNCVALTTLTIPAGVTTIESYAFYDCPGFTKMTVLATVPPTIVDEDVFYNVNFDIPVYVPAASLAAYQAAAVWKDFNLQAIAVNEFTVGGLTYEVIDQTAKTVEVINFTNELPNTATIPATVSYEGENYTVTAIAEWAFEKNETITEITISEGITSIGDYTFNKCVALTTVNIPASLTQMGDFVFNKCTALTAINVASGNTAYCSENGVLFNKEKTTLLCYPAGKPETDYTIPSSVTVIGVNAFSNCVALTTLTIPAGVTTIESYAFYDCPGFTKMTVLATVPPTIVDEDVFYNVNFDIPVYVPAASLAAYQAAAVWKEFNLQAIVTEFTVDGLTYNITDADARTVEIIGYTTGLPDVLDIPATVTNNGINYNVTSIGADAIWGIDDLTEVSIPNSITTIGENVFWACYYMTKVTIGSGVTSIGAGAFALCEGLTEMTVLATVPPTVGDDTFGGVSRNIPVYVPAASLAAYQAADVWKEFNLLALPATGLQTPSMPESISLQGGMLHNPQGLHLTIYDMQGRQVYSGNDATISLTAGVYVMRCNNASCKVLF